MSIISIFFKCSLMIYYNEMIQLFNQLIVPAPSNTQLLCSQTTSQNSSTIYYSNWGYAQLNTIILTPGQKYSIVPQNPGYITLNLGYFTDIPYVYLTNASNIIGTPLSNVSTSTSINYYYAEFDLNDYNDYINSTDIGGYGINVVNFNSVATAYAYIDENGFTIDLTDLPNNYAVVLGLVKFDYINQFTTYSSSGKTYYIYGMSTALNNAYIPNISSVDINTVTFFGIPTNTSVQFNQNNTINPAVGYRLNYNFLVNDETVNNSAFQFPTDLSNVGINQQATNAQAQLASITSTSEGEVGLVTFGSPQSYTYYFIIYYTNGTYDIVQFTGSSPPSGIPNTNAIIDSNITLPQPAFGGGVINLKSLYNNNGYNDVWIFSSNTTLCSSTSNEYYVLPPYFMSLNSAISFAQLNSNSPDILFQYITQAPIVQINTVTTSSTTSSTPPSPCSYLTSSTPMTQASSSSNTTSTSQPTTTSSSTTSSTSTTTITTVTQQIITALANPIIALILALALVGLALFVFM